MATVDGVAMAVTFDREHDRDSQSVEWPAVDIPVDGWRFVEQGHAGLGRSGGPSGRDVAGQQCAFLCVLGYSDEVKGVIIRYSGPGQRRISRRRDPGSWS